MEKGGIVFLLYFASSISIILKYTRQNTKNILLWNPEPWYNTRPAAEDSLNAFLYYFSFKNRKYKRLGLFNTTLAIRIENIWFIGQGIGLVSFPYRGVKGYYEALAEDYLKTPFQDSGKQDSGELAILNCACKSILHRACKSRLTYNLPQQQHLNNDLHNNQTIEIYITTTAIFKQ